MNWILFDDLNRKKLLPLVYTRPIANIRVGILTIREKWEHYLNAPTSTLTEHYLREKYPLIKSDNDNIFINGSVLPTEPLLNEIKNLKRDEALVQGEELIAMRLATEDIWQATDNAIETKSPITKINHPWDIFAKNHQAIIDDFALITKNRKSANISPTVRTVSPENIFVEEGATMECCVLNASKGPIYIGKNAEVMEGSCIRGPFALCEHSVVKLNTSIYDGTTIGPYCKVGGEISNSVFFSYSNKPHDGFVGNSVIGEWCNLAAGTITSNLNNSYEKVKAWSYDKGRFINTEQQFCGTIMGDYSKTGINTMLNTGTVIGVNSNVFGEGYQRNFISSFSWGTSIANIRSYQLEKAFETAKRVYERRNRKFDSVEENILRAVYQLTSKNNWL